MGKTSVKQLLILAIAVTTILVTLPADASSASGGPQWYESGGSSGSTYNCILGTNTELGRSWVGFHGNVDGSPPSPRTGQVYYTKVGWGVSGMPCGNGGARVHIEIGLPAYTELAISSSNQVRCLYQGPNRNNFEDLTSDPACPQQPQQGQQGGLAFDPKTNSGLWATATGAIWEIWIPVKTSRPLSGATNNYPSACPSCYIAGVWMIDGNYSPWSYPMIGVPVAAGANIPPAKPTISYPVPSVRDLSYNPGTGKSYGKTVGYLYSEGTTGSGYIEIGTTKSYGYQSPYSITQAGNYEVFENWEMTPGETWHWRLCYDPDGAAQRICGDDQTFDTAPPPDEIAPTTVIKSGPRSITNKRSARFVLGSNEDDVSYLCNLDNVGFSACESSTPTFTGLGEGEHSLAVKAKDGAGNIDQSPAMKTWTIDTTAPTTTITGGPSGTVAARRATFKFSSSEARSLFVCSLDNGSFKACSTPKVYKNLDKGRHTFRVKAKDRAGNLDPTPAERKWRIS